MPCLKSGLSCDKCRVALTTMCVISICLMIFGCVTCSWTYFASGIHILIVKTSVAHLLSMQNYFLCDVTFFSSSDRHFGERFNMAYFFVPKGDGPQTLLLFAKRTLLSTWNKKKTRVNLEQFKGIVNDQMGPTLLGDLNRPMFQLLVNCNSWWVSVDHFPRDTKLELDIPSIWVEILFRCNL